MLDMDIINHVAAALGPESVLTNLTRGRNRKLICSIKYSNKGLER